MGDEDIDNKESYETRQAKFREELYDHIEASERSEYLRLSFLTAISLLPDAMKSLIEIDDSQLTLWYLRTSVFAAVASNGYNFVGSENFPSPTKFDLDEIQIEHDDIHDIEIGIGFTKRGEQNRLWPENEATFHGEIAPMFGAALAAAHNDSRFASDAAGWSIIAATGVHNGDISVAFPTKQVADILRNLQLLKSSNSWERTVGEILSEIYRRPLDLGKLGWNSGIELSNFWTRWFNGYLDGTPLDSELQKRVALIPDKVWEEGIEAVSEAINKIEAEFLLEKHPIYEDIFFNDETARIGRVPRPLAQPVRHEAVLIGIRDAIDDALAGNFLTTETYDIKRLDKMLEKDSKHPHVIEQKLMQVFKSLEGQMAKGVLPDAPEVEGLSSACAEGGLEMRSLYPEIAKARAERAAQSVKEASKDELATLDATKATIEQITEVEFGDDINRDIDEITDTHNRAAAGKGEVSADAVSRTGNRIAKIWLLTKKIAKGTALGGGAIIVGAEGIAAINEALPILLRLLGL